MVHPTKGKTLAATKHVKQLISWTLKEKSEDEKQAKEDRIRGGVKKPLTMAESYTGTSGHTTVHLKPAEGRLNRHALKAGDAVRLVPLRQGLEEEFCGILESTDEDELVVGLDDLFLGLDKVSTKWTICKDENKVVYERMLSVLKEMDALLNNLMTQSKAWPGDTKMINNLLPPYVKKDADQAPLSRFPDNDNTLNQSQKKAIDNCLSAQLSMIYGPPGTGKTQTLVELVKQLSLNGARVLACGPSNTSVDNLLERLSKCPIRSLRIGNPDRLKLRSLQKFSLDAKLKEYPSVKSIRSQMDTLREKINLGNASEESKCLYIELGNLKESLKKEEKEAIKTILNNHNVVFSTLSGVGSRLLEGEIFDALIIDEATQALEPECWIAISHAKRVVLVGDHHQLPPVVLCQDSGLEQTLFKRLYKSLPTIVRMLNTQYRMHEKIIGFSSKQLYKDKLESHASVKYQLLSDIPSVQSKLLSRIPLVFINTANKKLFESRDSKSTSNKGEALLAAAHLKALMRMGVAQTSVAIISPYTAQINIIRNELKDEYPNVEIGTVDGFQGREKDAVILSLVRSNTNCKIGFLANYRRINVALTRARRHLCIIADKKTVLTTFTPTAQGNFLVNLGKYLSKHAKILTPESCRKFYK